MLRRQRRFRRIRLIAVLGVVATAWTAGGQGVASGTAAPGGPGAANVVLITIDTLRADRVSAYGYERSTTPNIDRLIDAGIRFTQARTVEPLTSPALCSMVTSQYPHQHGSSRNGLRLRTGLASLPKALQAQGYRTAAFVGNWTLRDKLSGLAEHFETYEEVLTRKRWFGLVRRESTADDVTAGALDWLEEHHRLRRGEPFLLWAHYVEPHAPYRLQEDHLDQLGLADRKGSLTNADRYDTEVAYADRSVGDLLKGLDRLAPGERTLIVFTSDHGESLGEHKYWGHGRNLYEPTLHIPLSVTWPGHLPPSTVTAPALIVDIGPTVLGLMGHRSPAGMEGFDWSGVFRGEPSPDRRVTYYQAHRGAVISKHDSDLSRTAGLLEVGVLDQSRKEIYRLGKNRVQIFDLAADPGEMASLSEPRHAPSEGLGDWLEKVFAGLGAPDQAPPEPLDEESAEAMRSLGYVD